MNDKYKNYILAALSLYGIIRIDDLLNIYSNYEDDLNRIEFINTIISLDLNADRLLFYKDDIVANYYYDLNIREDYLEATNLLEEQTIENYYLPSKEALLEYLDPLYVEITDSLADLLEYIDSKKILPSDEINIDTILQLSDYFYSDGVMVELDVYLEDLIQSGFILNEENTPMFIELLENTTLDRRLYVLKGHTINEVNKD